MNLPKWGWGVGGSISSLYRGSNGPAERERIRQEEVWFCSLVLIICNNHNFTRRRLVSKCTTTLNCVIANEEASSVLAIRGRSQTTFTRRGR